MILQSQFKIVLVYLVFSIIYKFLNIMQLGVKIKELRARKGFTQENMADLLQMSATNYAYIG